MLMCDLPHMKHRSRAGIRTPNLCLPDGMPENPAAEGPFDWAVPHVVKICSSGEASYLSVGWTKPNPAQNLSLRPERLRLECGPGPDRGWHVSGNHPHRALRRLSGYFSELAKTVPTAIGTAGRHRRRLRLHCPRRGTGETAGPQAPEAAGRRPPSPCRESAARVRRRRG